MDRHAFWKWVAETLRDAALDIWHGDRQKGVFVIALVCVAVLTSVLWSLWYGHKPPQIGPQVDPGTPEGQWHPPSAEQVARVVKKKR